MTFYRLEALTRSKSAQAFSGEGGLRYAGRWNSHGTRVVYTSSSAALACLETLVHMQTSPKPEERWLFTIEVPDRLVEELLPLPRGWDAEPASAASRTVGDQWIGSQRSVALLVPSVVVPVEKNALLNPRHPLFKLAWVKKPTRFRYDPRLQ
ncbi:MAG: RES family NAD+ phosphorylase [Chthoniobacterales bacterium]|nr:RES family NAD+ phosphorylase [Chthoniobacterales bacterium]